MTLNVKCLGFLRLSQFCGRRIGLQRVSVCGMQVTSGHSLIDVDSVELSTECQHHSGELVRFYCDTCDVCVCVLCTYRGQPHSDDHNVLSFNDAVAVHRAPLTALLTECRQRLHDVRARYDLVVTHDQLIRKVSSKTLNMTLTMATTSCTHNHCYSDRLRARVN